MQAGGFGEFLGELELDIEGGKIVGYRSRLHRIAEVEEEDPAQRAIYARHEARVRKILDEKIFFLESPLSHEGLVALSAHVVRRIFGAELGMMFGPCASLGLAPERRYRVGAAMHLFTADSGGYPSLDGSSDLRFTRFRYLRDELIDFFRSNEAADILREIMAAHPVSRSIMAQEI